MSTEKISYQRLPFKSVKTMFIRVCVLAVLYAFIVPQYCDYTARTRIAEGINLASSAKVAIAEYYDKHQAFPPNNAAAGLAAPSDLSGNGFKSIEVHTTGSNDDAKAFITITYSKEEHKGKTIIFMTSAPKEEKTFTWDCRNNGTVPTIDRPAECRESSLSDMRPAKSIGVIAFLLCFLLVKCIGLLCVKKYSAQKFTFEIVMTVALFQVVDFIYVVYFSPFSPKEFFWIVQPFGYFLLGVIMNSIFEFVLYPCVAVCCHGIKNLVKKKDH